MGFSTSGSTAIIFVGMLVAVGIAYPALETARDERLTAIDDRDDRTLDIHNTDIALEGTSYDDNESTLTVTATNTGSTTLSVPATDLLLDGEYTELSDGDALVDEIQDRKRWHPGETLSITVATDRPDRVKLVTEHGIAETATEV